MDRNIQMEQASLAYIRAVAAHAGFQVTRPEVDDDSVDGTLISAREARPRVDFQAKATSRSPRREGEIRFELPIKNYDDRRVSAIVPRILIVVLMPPEIADWLSQSAEQLCLQGCAYWLSLADRPDVSNKATVTVRIPVENQFDTVGLTRIMADAGGLVRS